MGMPSDSCLFCYGDVGFVLCELYKDNKLNFVLIFPNNYMEYTFPQLL